MPLLIGVILAPVAVFLLYKWAFGESGRYTYYARDTGRLVRTQDPIPKIGRMVALGCGILIPTILLIIWFSR